MLRTHRRVVALRAGGRAPGVVVADVRALDQAVPERGRAASALLVKGGRAEGLGPAATSPDFPGCSGQAAPGQVIIDQATLD